MQQQYKWTYEDEAAENEVYKMIKKELGKENRQEIVRKSRIPIAPLPEKELREYEKIRTDNIAQLKERWAVKEAEWEAEWERQKYL